ncbi:MAG TPA: hypothetical protein VGJ45_08765 [Pseudonocardiaceae bacterium]
MTPDDDDMDADLRALFADQRLSVPVGEDAVASVVAGAKRRRRRRTTLMATGGALGVAVVLLAGGLFAGHVLPPNHTQTANPTGLPISGSPSPPPDRNSPRPVGPEVVGMPPNAPTVLGPTGYGDITMGLTAKQVTDTHLVNTALSGNVGCTGYTYVAPTQSRPSAAAAAAGESKSLYVYLSGRAAAGVQLIIAPPGVTTPDGIGVGSSVASLHATYRNLPAQKDSVQLVPVSGHQGLSYRFAIDNNTVSSVGLGLTDQTCLPY